MIGYVISDMLWHLKLYGRYTQDWQERLTRDVKNYEDWALYETFPFAQVYEIIEQGDREHLDKVRENLDRGILWDSPLFLLKHPPRRSDRLRWKRDGLRFVTGYYPGGEHGI